MHINGTVDPLIEVALRKSEGGEYIILEVADNGPGVPLELREKVFDPYFTLSGSTGLGLAIAKEVTASCGGTINCYGQKSGCSGAVFEARFPRETTPVKEVN
jgi:two-component system sporulation sensor kinase A